jgi:hypothetical protein
MSAGFLRRRWVQVPAAALLLVLEPAAGFVHTAAPDPVVYTLRAPAPETNLAEIDARIPTGGRTRVDLMMPVWSPGYYALGDYVANVQGLVARTPAGTVLVTESPKPNHWIVATGGTPVIVLSYKVLCRSTFVTGCWVGPDFAVINGPSVFISLNEKAERPHEVHLELPPVWKQSITSLDPAPDGEPNHYRGPDYDVLIDSPIVVGTILDRVHRDIVFSLCQYGMGRVWEWGAQVGGNLWRTTGDLTDVWSNMAAVGFRQAGRERWSKPGHWTDPDMLVIGKVGWGPSVHDTRLTPNEQITHITLWMIQAAPLLIGADTAQFDRFTTDLMTNDEVLEVNQDVLGRGGSRVWQEERLEVWVKPLADGTKAVALFNRGLQAADVTARWTDVGAAGSQPVRDLWRQRDLGAFADRFSTRVPAHGAVLVKVGRARP